MLQQIEQILETNEIARPEHLLLTNAILSGKNISDEDRRQINRIFDYLQVGRIKIVK